MVIKSKGKGQAGEGLKGMQIDNQGKGRWKGSKQGARGRGMRIEGGTTTTDGGRV